ncbi:MAG: ATP synthase F1 subunit epsilon [Tidjanibacter sp.]|nr:ATP synthase F1 subunit epsilon [Tidjanibacter sp.]
MAQGKIAVKIVSPKGEVFSGDVEHVTLPGVVSSFAVYPRHAPLISALEEGDIKCTTTEGEELKFHILSGFVEVNGDVVTVCVE